MKLTIRKKTTPKSELYVGNYSGLPYKGIIHKTKKDSLPITSSGPSIYFFF